MAGTRVLQVVTDTDRRGAQVFATDLHAALERRGWQVATVALVAGRTSGLDLPVLGRSSLAPATLWRLRAAMGRAAVTVAHGSRTLPACALAGLGTGRPSVYRSIGDPLHWACTPARRARVRLGLGRAAAVVALWPGAAAALASKLGVPVGKVSVIPNGVPAGRWRPADPARQAAAHAELGLDPDRPVVVYVGALTPEKDVGTAVEAVAEVDGCQLVVVGGGPLRDRLEAVAGRLAPGRVRFTGPVPAPQQVLATADLVVLPSRSEGMPAVLIEAGLAGLGAVATEVGGVAEIVVPGSTGELVPPGDPQALGAALRRALGRAEAYGQAARTRCLELFELEPVADRWSELLTGLVAG